MARTQTFSIRDFSGGMVKGVGDRDLAPNEMSDFKGFDNKKRTALVPLHSFNSIKTARAAGSPSGYAISQVPIGSYGCYSFGTDHLLDDTTPTTYAFTSTVITTSAGTKWEFVIDYAWLSQWAGTSWKVDCEDYGTIATFTSESGATHSSTHGWQLKINNTATSAKNAISASNVMNVTAVLNPMTAPSGVSSSSPGTNNDDAKITVTADRHGAEYADLEMSMYSTTSNPPGA